MRLTQNSPRIEPCVSCGAPTRAYVLWLGQPRRPDEPMCSPCADWWTGQNLKLARKHRRASGELA